MHISILKLFHLLLGVYIVGAVICCWLQNIHGLRTLHTRQVSTLCYVLATFSSPFLCGYGFCTIELSRGLNMSFPNEFGSFSLSRHMRTYSQKFEACDVWSSPSLSFLSLCFYNDTWIIHLRSNHQMLRYVRHNALNNVIMSSILPSSPTHTSTFWSPKQYWHSPVINGTLQQCRQFHTL